MKKKKLLIIITVLFTINLFGCDCKHDWKDATCENPRTCTLCGKVEGESLSHEWIEATCTEAKKCSVCGEVEGEPLGHTWIDATYTEPKTCSVCEETEGTVLEQSIYENIPEGLSTNEIQWQNWESQNVCGLFPFMGACEKANYTYSLPSGQQKNHKEGTFIFNDNGTRRTLECVTFYYGVADQDVFYVGLNTSTEDIYKSGDFIEACIRMMISYNIHYDNTLGEAVLNLTRERAEEIVHFCFDNEIEHCIVDQMRIRLVRTPEQNYYSFHIEY